MMKKRSLTSAGNDGRDLAAALAPHRDAILSQLAQTWRMRAPKNTVMLGAPQRAEEAADSIGSVWFGWLENVTDLSVVRELAIDLVRQELAYTTASALVQSLATIVSNIAASDTPYEVAALKLVRQFSAAFLDQIATQHELRTQQEQEHLSVLLGASAEVGRAAASILDTDQLLREVVNLISDRFGFYYAAVFTLDHTGQYAVLREATGQAGEVLKNLNHKLDIHSQSMVGAVITSQRPRIAAEVGRDVPRFSNPLLPGTQSEIALPLSVGDRVLGALDVQSTGPRAFDETTVIVLQNMADQIAIALENARLFERTQANLHESQKIQANLARNQAQLADALKIAKLAYWEYDVEHDLFLFNDQFFSIFHTTAEQHGGYQLSSAYYARHFVHPDDLGVVGGEIEKALNSTARHYSRQLEHRMLYASGEVGYLLVNINIDRDEAGRIVRYYGANEDITERKQAEATVQRERGLLRGVIDSVPDLIFYKDVNGGYVGCNRAFEAFAGRSEHELIGQTDRSLFPADIAEFFREQDAQLLAERTARRAEEWVTYPDGRRVLLDTLKTPFYDEAGQVLGLIGISRDITARKLADSERDRLLARTETLYHTSADLNAAHTYTEVLDVLRAHTVLGEADRNISLNLFDKPWVNDEVPDWSITIDRWTTLPVEAVLDRYPLRSFPAAALLRADAPTIVTDVAHDERLDEATRQLFTVQFQAGSTLFVPLVASGQWIGYLNAVYGQPRAFSDEDIRLLSTAMEQAGVVIQSIWRLSEMAESEARFRDIALASADIVWETDARGRFTFCSDRIVEVIGFTLADVIGKEPYELIAPDDVARVKRIFQQATIERAPIVDVEVRTRTPDGRTLIMLTNGVPMLDAQGAVSGYRGVLEDITARRQIELDLAQERNLLRTIIDALPERIFAKDLESRFTLANVAEIRLGGASSFEELRGKNDFDFYPPELAQQYYDAERAILVEGQSLVGYEERSVDQAGNPRWHISTKVPLRDVNQQIIGLVGMTRDITEMKKVEAALAEEGNRLRTLIDNLPHSVYIKDHNSRFLVNNLAHLRVLGATSQDEVAGKNDFDFFDADMAGRYYANEQELMRVGQPLLNREETVFNQTTNQLQSVSSTKVPLRNSQGEVVGFVGFTQDITERKQAEVEREQLLARQQYHAVQLQTAAEISRVATSILNPDQLLAEIVKLIAARFGFYHVAAFTVDDSGRWAILRDATGEVGQQLKDRGQALAIRGQSLVGGAIRQRQPQIALDVGADAVTFNDPLLPDTHSEIALPLFVGDRVLGALDVYATTPAAFDDSYAILLQGLADQIAVALNNAEQYQREQAHVEQTNRLIQIVIDLSEQTDRAGLQARLVRSALALLDTDRAQFWLKGISGLELKAAQSVRPGADQSLAISQELADRVCSTGLPLRLDSPPAQAGYASRITDVAFNTALSVPISWQGQITGVLSVMRSQPGRPFTQDDENSAQLLAAQAAAALENITLAEQQQHRAVQLQTAAEVSRASSSILQLEELLNTVVELVRDNFNLYYVGTFLLDEEAEWAYLRAGTGEAGRKMLQAGHRLRVDESSMIGWSIVHRQARIAVDVGTDATRFDNPVLPNTRSEMALPLISRGRIIGAATIQSTRPAAFTPDDITTLQTMADQITTAVENARLFEQTQQSIQHMTILNEVMRTISQETELEWMLKSTYQGVRRLLPVDAFQVALYDRVANRVSYPLMVDEGESHTEPASPINPYSRIGRVIRSAEPILENVSREELAATPQVTTGTPGQAARLAASELVVPLRQGNQTIGALAVQSYQPGAYTRQHLELLENVASQLSVAIVNADLLEQSHRAIEELNDLNRRLTGEAWQSYVQARSADAVVWYANDSTLQQVGGEQAEQLAAGEVAVQHLEGEAEISVPITLRGQLIGALRFRAPADKWTDETRAMAASVASHLAHAAENTRLIEQTQSTARRESRLNQIAQQLRQTTDIESILQTATEELSRALGTSHAQAQLGRITIAVDPENDNREHVHA